MSLEVGFAYLIKEGLPCHVKDINLHIIVVYPESEQKCAYVFTNNADYQFQISSPLFFLLFLHVRGYTCTTYKEV